MWTGAHTGADFHAADNPDPTSKEGRAERPMPMHSSPIYQPEKSRHLPEGRESGVCRGRVPFLRNQEWQQTSFSFPLFLTTPLLLPTLGPYRPLQPLAPLCPVLLTLFLLNSVSVPSGSPRVKGPLIFQDPVHASLCMKLFLPLLGSTLGSLRSLCSHCVRYRLSALNST